MKSIRTLILIAAFSLSVLSVRAATPIGGLTVAVSEDGTQLVAGGDTRTLLVLDPETLEVKSRQWVGTSIVDLIFNGDGSVLAVVDSSDSVFLYSTADWSLIKEVAKVANFSAAPEAGLFAGRAGSYNEPNLEVYSFADGTVKTSIPVSKDTKVAMLALKGDGSKIAVLTQGDTDPDEPKVERADIPKELKGFELKEFEQRNDGRTSSYLIFDVAGGAIESESKTFYEERSGLMAYNGDTVLIVAYGNENASISPEGEFTLFELENSYNYGRGLTRGNGMILTGGLANYSFTPVDTMQAVTGKIDKLPGWPEYWKGFSGTADGKSLYGGSSAYRVVKFNTDGTVAAKMEGH
ncbi:hypothetical protein VSU19_17590 [Verrucomicrobiales bacterium BCK34]|nr:hypothetical protein [Verrucomicrobiales bacterium BCK34]